MNNLCNEKMKKFCRDYLNETKSLIDANKICACDYEPGVYDIPTMQLPIQDEFLKNMKDFKEYFVLGTKGVSKILLFSKSFDKNKIK